MKRSVLEKVIQRMPEHWNLDGFLEIHPKSIENDMLGCSLRIRHVRLHHNGWDKAKCLCFLDEVNDYLPNNWGVYSDCSISFESKERGDIYHIFGYCYAYGGDRKQYESFHPQYRGMEKAYTIQLDDVKCDRYGKVSITLRIPHKSFEDDIVKHIRSLDTMHVKSIDTMITSAYGYSPVVSVVNEWLEELLLMGLVEHTFHSGVMNDVHTFIFSPQPRNSIYVYKFSTLDIYHISNILSSKLAVMQNAIFYDNKVDFLIDKKDYSDAVKFTVHCYRKQLEKQKEYSNIIQQFLKSNSDD